MDSPQRARLAERVAIGLVLGLGALHAAAAVLQESMNEDGIGYLDVAAAWLRGDWSSAVSATWSPLYALLLSPAAGDAVPMGWRLPLVHGLNFAIFVLALVSFGRLWRELGDAAERRALVLHAASAIPRAAWLLAGYALFAWATLNLIEMWSVTPDMLLAAILFGAAALLLRSLDDGARFGPFRRFPFLYGLVLGLGFLAKPVMFPLGLAFVGIAAVAWWRTRPGRAWHLAVASALVGFAVLALPWAVAVSIAQGEATFGKSGDLTYMRYVNDVAYPFWDGAGSAAGAPIHPIPRLNDDPPLYAFGGHAVNGTYPPGFDPAYWYAGLEPRLVAGRQLEEAAGNAVFTFSLLVRRLGIPLGALLVLLGLTASSTRSPGPRPAGPGEPVSRAGSLAVLGLGATGVALYLPVLVEGRYLGVFIVLAFGGALALVRITEGLGGIRAARLGAIVVVAGLVLEIAAFNVAGAARVAGMEVPARSSLGFAHGPATKHTTPGDGLLHAEGGHLATARALVAAGVRPGAPVGVIGFAFDSYWAWLADLRVVAEIPADQGSYWRLPEDERLRVDRLFGDAGARWIVAEDRPADLPAGWQPLADTGLALRRLGH